MATCLIGLGANQGNRAANLAAAVELLSELPEISQVRTSGNYPSQAAVGGASQNEFLNAALTLQTSLAPATLLAALQNIENQLGRRCQDRWAPREIDLDLLLYDDQVQSDPTLVLPHPRMAFRRFVLQPAAEIAPNFVHPTTGLTVSELLTHLDRLPRRVSITGVSNRQTKRLARESAAKTNAVLVEFPGIKEPAERIAALRASPTCRTAIELLHQQRGYLRSVRRARATTDAANATEVNSSWIGEDCALAQLLLPADELKEFERTWKSEPDAEELDRTTLIVVLLVAPGDERTAAFQTEIEKVATVPGQSPWLLLDGQDPDWALREVIAAIEAMR